MAQLTEANQIGIREDLADIISIVDMKDTPLYSGIPKGKELVNTLFDWQADDLAAPVQTGVVDGVDATTSDEVNPVPNRARIQGRCQKQWRVPRVSDFAENVSNVAGLGKRKEMANAVAKGIRELKRDAESVLGCDNDSQNDAGGSTENLTRGLGVWIQNGAQSDLPVDSNYRTPTASIYSGAIGSMTETSVQNILESLYNETGQNKNYMLVCGTKVKRRFTDFSLYAPDLASHATVQRFNQNAETQKIVQSVDFFKGDTGSLELHLDLFLGYGTAADAYRGYILDMQLLKLRFSRMPKFKPLPDLGGGPRGIIDEVFGLEVLNPLGLGKIAGTA